MILLTCHFRSFELLSLWIGIPNIVVRNTGRLVDRSDNLFVFGGTKMTLNAKAAAILPVLALL